MTKLNTTLMAALLLILFCAHGYSQPTLKRALEIRTIAILPYGIQADEASGIRSPGGIYYDIANLLAEEAGYQANNYIVPYARIIFELKSGQTDMSILFKYPELAEHVIYIAPLPPLQTVVIGLKGSRFEDIEVLKGKRLAYLRGAQFSDAIDQNKDIITVETLNFVLALKMMLFNRVDAIIGPMDPILSAAIKLGKDIELFGEPLVVSERTPWVQVSKQSADKVSVEHLRSTFAELEAAGAISQIRNQYIKPAALPSTSP